MRKVGNFLLSIPTCNCYGYRKKMIWPFMDEVTRWNNYWIGNKDSMLYSADQSVPKHWQKFLMGDGWNKEALVELKLSSGWHFLATCWKEITMFYVHGEEWHVLKCVNGKISASAVCQLQCSHEEADTCTCMVLHANYIVELWPDSTIIIKSLDTESYLWRQCKNTNMEYWK